MKFTKSHEWVEKVGDNYRIGITDYAQEHLNDIVYVESVDQGKVLKKGDRLGTLESVKAAEDFYSPVDAKILNFNQALNDDPALVNTDCYGNGHIVEVELLDPSQLDELMDEAAYKDYVNSL